MRLGTAAARQVPRARACVRARSASGACTSRAVARADAAVGEVLGSDRLVRVVEFFLALGNHMNGHARSVAAAPSAAGVKLSSLLAALGPARRAARPRAGARRGAAARRGGRRGGRRRRARRRRGADDGARFGIDLIVRRGEGDALSFLEEMPTLARGPTLPDARHSGLSSRAPQRRAPRREELRAGSAHWAAMDARRARRAAATAAAAEAEAARASIRMRAAEAARARARARAGRGRAARVAWRAVVERARGGRGGRA